MTIWKDPSSFPTKLVENIYVLRTKNLKDFDSNDFRTLISQDIGLKYLVPRIILRLQKNILDDALYYPGDLLLALFNIEPNYWRAKYYTAGGFDSYFKK